MQVVRRALMRSAFVLAITAWVFAVAAVASPPVGAVLLFDGGGQNLLVGADGGEVNWPIENGELVSTPNSQRSNNLVSRLHFRDAEIHVEFKLPATGDGNSGVYLQGLYEIQILGTAGKQKLGDGDMGAVYGLHRPLVNADLGPNRWQALDVRYIAPRRDARGAIVADGTVDAWLNGKQIQKNARVGEKTSAYNPFVYDSSLYLRKIYEQLPTTKSGPLLLQDHDSPVRFRNVWVKPLDDHATLDGAPVGE